jgi:non-ribosomal peptide synthetase component F
MAWDAGDRLECITARTLVVTGTADAVVDPRNSELIAARIPAARLELILGAGHNVFGAAAGVRPPRRRVRRMMPLTVDRMLRDRARATPNRVAIEARGGAWTYAELDARSDAIAAGLAPGSRVSTLTANTPEHVAVFFGCAKAAAILRPISWRLAPSEVAFQLDDAQPALLLVEEEHRAPPTRRSSSHVSRPRRRRSRSNCTSSRTTSRRTAAAGA